MTAENLEVSNLFGGAIDFPIESLAVVKVGALSQLFQPFNCFIECCDRGVITLDEFFCIG
jgi:hypothetical protein